MLDFNESVSNDTAYGFPKLPKDTYTLRIASSKIKRSERTGGLALTLELRVLEGVATGHEQHGMVHFEDYWLGTEEDPDAEDPATQKGKMRRNFDQLRLMAVKSGAGATFRSTATGEAYYAGLGDAMVGQTVRATIDIKHESERTDKHTGKTYEASDRNRIIGVFGVDEKLPGQRLNGPAAAPQVRRTAQPFVVTD